MPVDERTGTQALDAEECWRRLEGGSVARLGVIVGKHPDIFPVNYRVRGREVLIRTAPGTKLAAAVLGGRVALEIDAVDHDQRSGWSVVVHGRAEELESLEALQAAERTGLAPWAVGVRDRWIRVVPEHLTGRAIPGR